MRRCLVASFIITKFPKTPFELARLVYFQYPVSQWLFIIRSVGFFAYIKASANSVSTAFYA